MNEIIKCRTCKEWYTTAQSQWRGNCKPHHTDKDRWSETANANGCPDYKNKYQTNPVGSAEL